MLVRPEMVRLAAEPSVVFQSGPCSPLFPHTKQQHAPTQIQPQSQPQTPPSQKEHGLHTTDQAQDEHSVIPPTVQSKQEPAVAICIVQEAIVVINCWKQKVVRYGHHLPVIAIARIISSIINNKNSITNAIVTVEARSSSGSCRDQKRPTKGPPTAVGITSKETSEIRSESQHPNPPITGHHDRRRVPEFPPAIRSVNETCRSDRRAKL